METGEPHPNEPETKRARVNPKVKEDTVELPSELQNVDFSQRVSWSKCEPYSDIPLPLHPLNAEPSFTTESPALCHYIHAISGRARACTVHLKPTSPDIEPRPIPTPMFMPVGTKGCLKGIAVEELVKDLQCPIILGNTYHLAIQPGTELVDEMGGLHNFQGLPSTLRDVEVKSRKSYNLLTDSGGFQMVSLVKLSNIDEEGVNFENPFKKGDMLLLRPEDSIRHQNNIGANIIMALDDVVSSVVEDEDRFIVATHRTLRWYDRCYKAHSKPHQQNLFPIVQGGLDITLGGKRELCLAGFRQRELNQNYKIPGYAIGGLAGGESKDDFWKVIDQCCKALPDTKPRYLMGVGYPLDLVVCTALGCDMYDCVYPTRTARFGVALVPGKHPGTLRLRSHECSTQIEVIQEGCRCQACRQGISRSRLHSLLKNGNPVSAELLTQHNICYMMTLVHDMRQAIIDGRFATFAKDFVNTQFVGKEKDGEDCPSWVKDALNAAGIALT